MPSLAAAIAAPEGQRARSVARQLTRGLLILAGLPKSLLFNLRYLPLREALRLPILVSHRMAIFNLSGSVRVPPGARTGTVLLGFGANGAFDFRRSRSTWQNAGTVIFEGPARLGSGFHLVTDTDAVIRFGTGFVLSAESQIISRRAIIFGADCLISWGVLVIDTDYHPLLSEDGAPFEIDAPIRIGERVWIAARSTVLKGVTLGDDTVVAAGSVISRSEAGSVLLGGNPARRLRENVRWQH